MSEEGLVSGDLPDQVEFPPLTAGQLEGYWRYRRAEGADGSYVFMALLLWGLSALITCAAYSNSHVSRASPPSGGQLVIIELGVFLAYGIALEVRDLRRRNFHLIDHLRVVETVKEVAALLRDQFRNSLYRLERIPYEDERGVVHIPFARGGKICHVAIPASGVKWAKGSEFLVRFPLLTFVPYFGTDPAGSYHDPPCFRLEGLATKAIIFSPEEVDTDSEPGWEEHLPKPVFAHSH